MRRHRVEYDGALYHVIQRSNNREKIFGSDSDKKLLIDLVTGCSRKLGIKRKILEEILGSSGASVEDIKLICSGSRKKTSGCIKEYLL